MTVSLEDLEKICIENNIEYIAGGTIKKNPKRYTASYYLNEQGLEDYDVYLTWSAGGVSGGSCWDEGEPNHTTYAGDPEPEFDALDNILEKINPNITFLQYKKLTSALVSKEQRTEYEYYGNSSNTGIKKFNLKSLATYINDNF